MLELIDKAPSQRKELSVLELFITALQVTAPILLAVLAWFKWRESRRFKRVITTRSSWAGYMRNHQEVELAVLKLLNSSDLDRFLILEVNLFDDPEIPNHVSSVYQIRSTNQEERDYYQVRIDLDYETRTAETESKGVVLYTTADMRDCIIKDFYEDEQVKSAAWGFIEKSRCEHEGVTRIAIFSIGSHEHDLINVSELARIRGLQGKICQLSDIYNPKKREYEA